MTVPTILMYINTITQYNVKKSIIFPVYLKSKYRSYCNKWRHRAEQNDNSAPQITPLVDWFSIEVKQVV